MKSRTWTETNFRTTTLEELPIQAVYCTITIITNNVIINNVIVTRDSSRSLWYYSLGLIHPTLEEFKNVGFTSVSVDEKRVENEALWFHCLTIVPTQIQNELTNDYICCVFKFLLLSESLVMTENNWCVFRVKTPFSNFSGVVCTEDKFDAFSTLTSTLLYLALHFCLQSC